MRHRVQIVGLGVALALLVGCAPTTAIINGQSVARPTFSYSDGKYFAITHYQAFPEQRGPSSGLYSYGGRIAGRVCSVDVAYEAEYHGGRMAVTGFARRSSPQARVQVPVQIEVRDHSDEGGRREFTGVIGNSAPSPWKQTTASNALDLHLRPDHLGGQVGSRTYNLFAEGNRLVGTVEIGAQSHRFIVDGRDELWAMSPADQATLLPLLLSCAQVVRDDKIGKPVLVVDLAHLVATR